MPKLEYEQLNPRLKMLEFLHRALDETQKRRDPGLILEFYNPPPRDGLESYNILSQDDPPRLTVFGTRVDVAQELGLSGADAISLLKDLETDGYVHLDYGSGGPYIDAGEVTIGFTQKGRATVAALSDPNEALPARLTAIAEAIKELEGVDRNEKKPAIDAVEELKHFVHALPPETAVELLRRLPSVLGLGSG